MIMIIIIDMSNDNDNHTHPGKASEDSDRVWFTPDQPIPSEVLLSGGKSLWIRHNDELYCLRITRQNKLLLTK